MKQFEQKLGQTEIVIERKIDKYIDRILKASGSSLSNYTMESNIDAMRKEMKSIIDHYYEAGRCDCLVSLRKGGTDQ